MERSHRNLLGRQLEPLHRHRPREARKARRPASLRRLAQRELRTPGLPAECKAQQRPEDCEVPVPELNTSVPLVERKMLAPERNRLAQLAGCRRVRSAECRV